MRKNIMKRKYVSLMVILCVLLHGVGSNIQSASAATAPSFYFPQPNGTAISGDVITIDWWWFYVYNWDIDPLEFPDDETANLLIYQFSIAIKSNINNQYYQILIMTNNLLQNLPTSITINLTELAESVPEVFSIEQQTFAVSFAIQYTISRTSYGWFSFKWNPSTGGGFSFPQLNISQITLILFIILGFAIFAFGIYWFLISCRNVENMESLYCQQRFIDRQLRKSQLKQQEASEKEIRAKLFSNDK